MQIPRFIVWMLPVLMTITSAATAATRDYPYKPIRIVTSGIGASGDVGARLMAQWLSGPLGQQVVVDNRGSGVIPGEIVARAQPDGYTLLVYGTPLWIGPLIQKTPYDAVRDFSPITIAAKAPNVLVVYPMLPAKSVKELIALAKAKPLNYVSQATGGSAHLAAELFKFMAGVNMLRIPYKSGATSIIDLISGQVQVWFATGSTVALHLKSGRMRALAVGSAEPSVLFPDLPTVAASGVPGYESETPTGILAPAETPAAIINRLNQEIVRALKRPEVQEQCFNAGVDPVGSSPQEFAAKMKSEIARLGKVIRDAGIRAD